ncbi:MAG TPA: EscU/YscU/HrcU family type III secretion system export apparatus switch protein, partial [Limnochordia bacterium]
VVAKGRGEIALRIRERARAAGVPVVSDAALAAALLQTEIGRTIAPQVYHLVAKVLAFVYAANARAGRERAPGSPPPPSRRRTTA